MPEKCRSLSLRVLIPYFGQWPVWFPFFLRSCAENPGVSWVLFSDCGVPLNCPNNVRVVETTFEQYCQQVSSRLGIDFAPRSARKLCDIKPTLAAVHPEFLEDVSYWAFGDIDLIYGQLQTYLHQRNFTQHDVLSLHERRLSGHLTVLRNDPEINAAYTRVSGWQELLEDDRHKAFDEKAFTRLFLRFKNSPRWVRWLAQQRDPWLKRAAFQEAYTTPDTKVPWVDGSFDFPRAWYWQHGRLWNDKDQTLCYPYIHFMHWKKQWQADEVQGVEHAWAPSLRLEVGRMGIRAVVDEEAGRASSPPGGHA